MFSKSTTNVANKQQLIHRLPAGMMQGDKSTEIFGCRETQKVYALSDGKSIPFEELNPALRAQIFEKLLDDSKAMEDLKHLSQTEAISKYAFCVYGAADSNADFCANGKLKEADNFICSKNCQCLKWQSKNIIINGNRLTIREIEIIQLLATDKSDKMIADELGISTSTLDTHKNHLFEKAGVFSKNGLIMLAASEKIVQ
jgi:DNA-binding CsgD family transcriptional regulator